MLIPFYQHNLVLMLQLLSLLDWFFQTHCIFYISSTYALMQNVVFFCFFLTTQTDLTEKKWRNVNKGKLRKTQTIKLTIEEFGVDLSATGRKWQWNPTFLPSELFLSMNQTNVEQTVTLPAGQHSHSLNAQSSPSDSVCDSRGHFRRKNTFLIWSENVLTFFFFFKL